MASCVTTFARLRALPPGEETGLMAKKKQISESEPLFKVGDRVSFPFGSGEVSGVIVEDRGCLGVGGRRLYGIKFELNPDEEAYIEMPEEELTTGAAEGRRSGGKV